MRHALPALLAGLGLALLGTLLYVAYAILFGDMRLDKQQANATYAIGVAGIVCLGFAVSILVERKRAAAGDKRNDEGEGE